MKKFLVWLCVGALTFGMVSCGSQDAGNDGAGSQTEEPAAPSDTSAEDIFTEEPDQDSQDLSTKEPDQDLQDVPTTGDVGDSYDDGYDYADGWSEEMEAVKTAVTDLLEKDYFPDTALNPEEFEYMFGITPDMYEDYFAEIPLIGMNEDKLIVVKAADGQIDVVEDILNSYRDGKVSETFAYPQNVGKIQASKVERFGNYVIFTMLGGDVMDLMDQGDEAVITHCQEVNDSVIEAVKAVLQ